MKILFVDFRDDVKKTIITTFLDYETPLTFPILAALTPCEYSIDLLLVDEKTIDRIDFDADYDLIGITVITQNAFLAYKIADEFRRRGKKVILGGRHPSVLPDEAVNHSDSVVIGEAEGTWPKLLKDFKKNKLKKIYFQDNILSANRIPMPKNDIYQKGTNIAIQASRGCINRCEFCSMSNIKFRKNYRKKPIKKVIEEIKNIPNRTFVFHDNSLTNDPDYTKELFKAMTGLNKRFCLQGNQNVLNKDEELLKLSREAGCIDWFVGFESISEGALKEMGKKSNSVKEYISTIKKIHNYGMTVRAGFIFGSDHDKIDIFERTDEFVRISELDVPQSIIITPFPGTPLFDRLETEGRIITKDWSKYKMDNVVFQPKNMTSDKLLNETQNLQKSWYKSYTTLTRIIKSMNYGFYPFFHTARRNLFWYYYQKSISNSLI